MRRISETISTVLLGLGLATSGIAQDKPDVIVFDEDDAIGVGYYDASVGIVSGTSTLSTAGPEKDKLIIVTSQHFNGVHSGLLEWKSAPGGSWKFFIANPVFQTRDTSGYSNLVFYVNAPKVIAASHLPKIGLESGINVTTPMVEMGDFLPEGLDGDIDTWQKVSIPLTAFQPYGRFSLSQFKDVNFSQGAADNTAHTLWLDNLRIVAGGFVTKATPPMAPSGIVTRFGEQSVVLHWNRNIEPHLAGYNVYRSRTPVGPFTKLNNASLSIQSFADLSVIDGLTYYYQVRAINLTQQESPNSSTVSVTPQPFANDQEFLEYVQQTAFDYFWYEANPTNGLVRDRSESSSAASIAAVGFGLTAIGVGIDHEWITRAEGRGRTLNTLKTFAEKLQGSNDTARIGYKGWFYKFLDFDTGLRAGSSEISSIDTALLLAGVFYARHYFDGTHADEAAIRTLADRIVNRVDWPWMANGGDSLTLGWYPNTGFIAHRWIGYNEATILYLLGMGAATDPLLAAHWASWTSGYEWQTNYGHSFVQFPPLFGHQYSHCWVDFRHLSDAYMNDKGTTYFENSRRATLAQRAYAVANPGGFIGYGTNVWGFTACDGPGSAGFLSYIARGTPPRLNDDGTIAPTAAASSMPFVPEYSLPALRYFYDQFRTNIWTGYGFRDAFNLTANWWDPDVLGIDQGPILIMLENHRTQKVWKLFMQIPEIQRGLQTAGFVRFPLVPLRAQPRPGPGC